MIRKMRAIVVGVFAVWLLCSCGGKDAASDEAGKKIQGPVTGGHAAKKGGTPGNPGPSAAD